MNTNFPQDEKKEGKQYNTLYNNSGLTDNLKCTKIKKAPKMYRGKRKTHPALIRTMLLPHSSHSVKEQALQCCVQLCYRNADILNKTLKMQASCRP